MGRVEQEKSNYGSRFDQISTGAGILHPMDDLSEKHRASSRKRVGVQSFMHGLLGPCDGGCSRRASALGTSCCSTSFLLLHFLLLGFLFCTSCSCSCTSCSGASCSALPAPAPALPAFGLPVLHFLFLLLHPSCSRASCSALPALALPACSCASFLRSTHLASPGPWTEWPSPALKKTRGGKLSHREATEVGLGVSCMPHWAAFRQVRKMWFRTLEVSGIEWKQ